MKRATKTKTGLCLIAAFTGAIFLANPVSATDLRPAMKGKTWKEGSNVVHKGAGHKLIAEVKGGKIVRWSATDDKGNPLPTNVTAKGVLCRVCIFPPDTPKGYCYDVDCAEVPAPKPPPKSAQ